MALAVEDNKPESITETPQTITSYSSLDSHIFISYVVSLPLFDSSSISPREWCFLKRVIIFGTPAASLGPRPGLALFFLMTESETHLQTTITMNTWSHVAITANQPVVFYQE